jgi:hypothetical protein
MGLSFSLNKKFRETTSSGRNDLSLRRLSVSPNKVPWKTTSLAGNGLSLGKRRLNDNLLAKSSEEKGIWNVANVWDKIAKDKFYPNQELFIYLKLLKPKC